MFIENTRFQQHREECTHAHHQMMETKIRLIIFFAAKDREALCYAKWLQSCPTLRDPIDGSPPGSPITGILQARTLEWVAISFSNAWKWKVKVKSLSCVQLLATPWTAAYQAPPSMGFSRQEYWSGVPLPSLIYTLLCIKYWVSSQLFTVLFHPHQEIL